MPRSRGRAEKQGHWKDDYGAKPGPTPGPPLRRRARHRRSREFRSDRETGHYALVLALALALIQSTVPILGARWRDPP